VIAKVLSNKMVRTIDHVSMDPMVPFPRAWRDAATDLHLWYTTGWLGRAGCFCWTASIKTFVSAILDMCVVVVVTPQIRMRGSVMHVERHLAVSVATIKASKSANVKLDFKAMKLG
jgi:hypothetical protein